MSVYHEKTNLRCPSFSTSLITNFSILLESLDTVKEGNPEYNLDEPTMEQKLESLNLFNKCEFLEEQSASLAPPSADSVYILLKQALRADDHAELLKCMYNRDEKVWLSSLSCAMFGQILCCRLSWSH